MNGFDVVCVCPGKPDEILAQFTDHDAAQMWRDEWATLFPAPARVIVRANSPPVALDEWRRLL